ncbi:hypothetical protein GS940_24310, partial [Rhodococcus hoagii]|nr:hypothetical protein [Prescottella equi]
MVLSTLVLMFTGVRIGVLPIKAVAMAGLSLAATFGVSRGCSRRDTARTPRCHSAPLEATFVVLILA